LFECKKKRGQNLAKITGGENRRWGLTKLAEGKKGESTEIKKGVKKYYPPPGKKKKNPFRDLLSGKTKYL